MSEERVQFFSGGRERPAFAGVPVARREGGQGLPAVVLAHGLANDRDEAGQFGPLAERLCADGHFVLRFDFRGGVRDVDPGRQLPSRQWVEDLLAAIAYVRARDDVDPTRIGVVGASTGGSVAVYAAALEPTLQYVVTLGCFADGERWLRELWTRVVGRAAWDEFVTRLVDDRGRRAGGLASRRVALAGQFLPVLPAELPALEEFLLANPGMLRELALETADDILLFSPEHIGPRVRCPVLVVHGSDDTLVPLDEAARLAESLGDRATLRIVEAGPHQLLLGDQAAHTLDAVSDWIARVM
jgi:uncharacterized protein